MRNLELSVLSIKKYSDNAITRNSKNLIMRNFSANIRNISNVIKRNIRILS